MRERITNKDIESLCNRINEITGDKLEPWTKNKDGVLRANIGNYHISGAYGGVMLHKMVTEGGGVTAISTTGYGTKRELYTWMTAFIHGMTI